MRNHSHTTGTKADGFRRFEVITGVGRCRRWTAEEKARIVAESLDPATTSSAVARRYGLHASQLFVWRQQLQRSASSAETIGGPTFVPVLMAEDRSAPTELAGRMELAEAGGAAPREVGPTTAPDRPGS
jgi:transposase